MVKKNTFDAYDVSISFMTNKENERDAWEELCKLCERNGISLIEGFDCALYDENGNQILE